MVGFPAVLPRFTPCPRHVRNLSAAVLGACLLAACSDPNTGVDPPIGNIFFPEGLLLDPRTPADQPASYLFVSNGNNDLSFNGGSISVIDLDAFFAAWSETSDADGDPDTEETPTYVPFPYCEGAGGRCVLDVGSPTSEDFPCRRLGLLPQEVECDETSFVVDGVRLGDFSTLLSASQEDDGPRLWVPVRGDPSITYIDVDGELPDPPDLNCGQREVDGEAFDESRCDDGYKLTHLRNDTSLEELDREPFSVHISVGDGYRYGVVSHSASQTLSLIDLDGLDGDPDEKPALVDMQNIFTPTSAGVRPGGYGIATRSCGACQNYDVDDMDMDGFDAQDNTPAITQDCTRPLVYGSLRYQLLATSFTASGLDDTDLPDGAAERTSCEDDQGNYVGPFCASPDEVGDACALICEPQVRAAVRFETGGLDPLALASGAALGDVAFGDECSDSLYVLQTNPGALLRLDTRVVDGEPLDSPAGAPIELCDQPSRFEIWQEHGLAFVSCFQAAYVYVVDLNAERVIDTVITGTGPHDVALDEVRQMLYVTNLLEGSISVIDVGRDRPTRYKEVARLGLQDPFSR